MENPSRNPPVPAADPVRPSAAGPTVRTGPGFWTSLGRSQIASLSATVVDFGMTFFLTEVVGFWYVASTATGAAMGAITNFLIGRHWSFEAADGHLGPQAFRYALVSAGSLLINTGAVYAITEYGGLPYGVSKVIAAICVGFFFNFPLHRHYVFRAGASSSNELRP